jgi:hypothetical protein
VPAAYCNIKQKQKKAFVIPVPDAVVHPHAVVVHAQHALVALPAVVRARRFVAHALFAKSRPTFSFSFYNSASRL